MPSPWTDKLCQRCGGGKGAKYLHKKYCGKCQFKVKKEKSKNAHSRALETRYGITKQDYWDCHTYQDGHCFICRRATGATRRLTVDHDHDTGLVRGLLCRPCNTMLGHLRDDVAAFLRVVEYLTDPPFQAMLKGKQSTWSNNGRSERR